ncbi:MAG: hypothetical protein EHM20_00070 [Alphaproteobacteria bacterium]|nr:MAG: hypothetical protein EHM20_00070 [Alphaproteobacteria bacterium]
MEWLKKLLGEDKYKKLEESGMLEILKTSLGEIEYIPNDPKQVIPKHVFNEKNDRVKLLEGQITEYEKQVKGISGMVTDKTMQEELAKQEAKFKLEIKNQETIFNSQIEKKNKEFLLTNLLAKEGVKHPELLLKVIDLDSVILADNTIVNHEKILTPLKEDYKVLFSPPQVTGQTPPKGETTPPANNKDELIKQFNTYQQNGDPRMFAIQRQIKALDETEK